jgi:hypothetical protein
MILKGAGTIRESDCVKAQFIYVRPRPVYAVIGIILLVLFVWTMLDSRDPFLIGIFG